MLDYPRFESRQGKEIFLLIVQTRSLARPALYSVSMEVRSQT